MKDNYLVKMVGNPLENPPNSFTNERTNKYISISLERKITWFLDDVVRSQQEYLLYSFLRTASQRFLSQMSDSSLMPASL